MSTPFTATGGARIGSMNASWPLASLSVTSEKLGVKATLLGTYEFQSDQVVRIERYTMIPILGWGIQIHHNRSDYPQRIIFWCLGSPESLLAGIRAVGFAATGPSGSIVADRGFAIRLSVIIGAVLAWNILLGIDFFRSQGPHTQLGPFTILAMALVFALSAGTLVSPKTQRLILKPGREISEIRAFLRLIAFITGSMALLLSAAWLMGGFPPNP